MMRRKTVGLLALLIFVAIFCGLPLAEKGTAAADGVEAATRGNTAAATAALAPEENVDDYSALFKLYSDLPDWGSSIPWPEEIKTLGPLWPNVPPKKNGVYYFVKANQDLIKRCKKLLPEPPGSVSGTEAYAGDAAGFARYINENASVLETIREGLSQRAFQLPFLIAHGPPKVPVPPYELFADIRNLARFLSDAGFADELEGRPDVAAERYLDCVQMGDRLQENSALIVHLTAIAVQQIGNGNLSSLLANSSLDEVTLKRIIALLRQMETKPKARLALLAREAEVSKVTVAMSPESAKAFGKDYDAFMAFMVKTYSKPLPELLRSAEAAIKEAKDKPPEFEVEHPWKAELLLEWPPRLWARRDLEMRVIQIRAAIGLYQKQHSAPPDRLDDLVPAFLPEVPADPFDGKPLRYARTVSGWKLWSVGYDLKDDGGGASLVDEKGFIGPDFVYTDKVRSNVERRSRGAIKSLPAPAQKPVNTDRAK
jgi:hypothetical protein